MSPSEKHPYTGKQNTRYMSITLELEDGADEEAWRDVLDNLQLYGSPHFAPRCQVVAMGAGDAMSELDAIEEVRDAH